MLSDYKTVIILLEAQISNTFFLKVASNHTRFLFALLEHILSSLRDPCESFLLNLKSWLSLTCYLRLKPLHLCVKRNKPRWFGTLIKPPFISFLGRSICAKAHNIPLHINPVEVNGVWADQDNTYWFFFSKQVY